MAAWLVFCLCWAGCAADKPFIWVTQAELPQRDVRAAYVIDSGDVISVKVYNDAAMSGPVTVRPDGYISLVLVGEVLARGKRPAELAKVIEAALSKYVTSPVVTITLDTPHPLRVSVSGQVQSPGVLKVEPGTRVAEVLALAGGLTEFADESRIFLVRPGVPSRVRFTQGLLQDGASIANAFQVEDGDLIIVE